eukprot:TRINITY_DN2401_c0_g1_i4.p1 TRINITY_DN2401_c0_g1~~TRINITY_DN2401_c0_g1_i4.p1  ORF type:complete len:1579 (+),score=521.91 TRINITY_DN2401_c0_g1_i4:181-4917(+)
MDSESASERSSSSKKKSTSRSKSSSVSGCEFLIPGVDAPHRKKLKQNSPDRITDMLATGRLFLPEVRDSEGQRRFENSVRFKSDLPVPTKSSSSSNRSRSRSSSVSSSSGPPKILLTDKKLELDNGNVEDYLSIASEEEKEEKIKLKKRIEKLLEREAVENVTDMSPSEISLVYQCALDCIVFPLVQYQSHSDLRERIQFSSPRFFNIHPRENYSALIPFQLNNYQILRRTFNIKDNNSHVNMMNRAMSDDYFLLTTLTEGTNRILNSNLYRKESFSNEDAWKSWKHYYENELKCTIERLKEDSAFQGTFSVQVVEAKDLSVKDKEEMTSSPYCEVKLVAGELMKGTKQEGDYDSKVYLTQVIEKNVNPTFMEEFSFSLGETFRAFKLRVTVWDNGPQGKSYMGEVELDLGTIPNQSTRDVWIPLQKQHKWNSFANITVSGEIRLRLHLVFRTLVTEIQPSSSPNFPHSHSEDFLHRSYVEVMERILKLENPTIDSKFIGISPLTKPLLEEFAFRYSIPLFFRQISYLEWLVDNWTLERAFLLVIYEEIQTMESISFKTKLSMKKEEREKYKSLTSKIREKIEDIFSHYQSKFNGRKMDGTLKALHSIYSLLLIMAREAPAVAIEKLLKSSSNELYLQYSSPELDGEQLSFSKLTRIAKNILQHLEDDAQIYQSEFSRETVLLSINSSIYRSLLLQDTTKVTLDVPSILSINTPEIFDLHFTIVELNKIWKNHLKMTPIPLVEMFEPYVLAWMDSSRDRLKFWLKQSINDDDSNGWQPLLLEKTPPLLHSNSVVDLYESLLVASNFLLSFEDSTSRERNIRNFVHLVGAKLVEFFVEQLKLACLSDVRNKKRVPITLHSPSLVPTPSSSFVGSSPLTPRLVGSFGRAPTSNSSFGRAPTSSGSFGRGPNSPLVPTSKSSFSPTVAITVTSPQITNSSPLATVSPVVSSPKPTRSGSFASKLFGKKKEGSSPNLLAQNSSVTSPPPQTFSPTGSFETPSSPKMNPMSPHLNRLKGVGKIRSSVDLHKEVLSPASPLSPSMARLANSPKFSTSSSDIRLKQGSPLLSRRTPEALLSSPNLGMESLGLDSIPPALAASPVAWRKKTPQKWIVPKELCVKLNDVEMVQALQEDYVHYLRRSLDKEINEEDLLSATFKPTVQYSKNAFSELVDLIVTQMNNELKIEVDRIFENQNKEISRTDSLVDYLNVQLAVLHANLYPGVFQSVLQKLFLILTKDLELQIIPYSVDDVTDRAPKIPVVEGVLESLIAFFTSDGVDLSAAYAEKHTRHLKDTISLFGMTTKELFEVVERKRKSSRAAVLPAIKVEEPTNEPKSSALPAPRKVKITISKAMEAAQASAPPSVEVPSSFALPALSILSSRARGGDAEAKEFLKSKKKEELSSRLMCNLMGVYDPSIDLVTKFLCSVQHCFGSLVILTSFICLHKFIGNTHPIVIPIMDIVALNKKDNKIVREKFGQPRETVIGVYSCYYRHKVPEFGNLIVTEGFIFFSSSRPIFPHHVSVPFASVEDLTSHDAALFQPTGMTIDTTDKKKYSFSSIQDRDGAYNLIHNLWERRSKYQQPASN